MSPFILAIGSIIFGIVSCFWGYKNFQVILAIWGFVLGGLIIGNILSGGNILVILIAGIIGAGVVIVAYYVGIFLIGAIPAFLIVSGFLTALHVSSGFVFVLGIMAASMGGILALVLNMLMIVLGTAFGGAMLIVAGVLSLLLSSEPLSVINSLPILAQFAWLGLGVAGVLVQLGGKEGVEKQFVESKKIISQKSQQFMGQSTDAEGNVIDGMVIGDGNLFNNMSIWIRKFYTTPAYPTVAAGIIGLCGIAVGMTLLFSISSSLFTTSFNMPIYLVIMLFSLASINVLQSLSKPDRRKKAYQWCVIGNAGYIIVALWLTIQQGALPIVEIVLPAIALAFLIRDERLKSYFERGIYARGLPNNQVAVVAEISKDTSLATESDSDTQAVDAEIAKDTSSPSESDNDIQEDEPEP